MSAKWLEDKKMMQKKEIDVLLWMTYRMLWDIKTKYIIYYSKNFQRTLKCTTYSHTSTILGKECMLSFKRTWELPHALTEFVLLTNNSMQNVSLHICRIKTIYTCNCYISHAVISKAQFKKLWRNYYRKRIHQW